MPNQAATKRFIDIVMISRLGVGDGGRETWIYNFMAEVSRQQPDVAFRIFSLPLAPDNILVTTDIKQKVDVEHIEIPCVKTRVPLVLSFVRTFPAIYRQHRSARNTESVAVVGVGSLGEALSVYLGSRGAPASLERIMWLRTVFTREKFDRIPCILMSAIKFTEESLLNRAFDQIVANGDDTAAYYRERGVECEVIHNAVRLAEYYGASRTPQGKLAVAFVGRLSDVKGTAEFLAAVRQAANSGLLDQVEFHVAGAGPGQAQVQPLHEQGLLHYHGALSNRDMPGFLAQMDCCVALTSFTPSLGGGGVSNALIEQMAARKIVVAWDNVIFRNALYDQEGYFVPQGDATALHQCFRYIVANPEEAQRKALTASEGVKRYDIRHHVGKFFELLDA